MRKPINTLHFTDHKNIYAWFCKQDTRHFKKYEIPPQNYQVVDLVYQMKLQGIIILSIIDQFHACLFAPRYVIWFQLNHDLLKPADNKHLWFVKNDMSRSKDFISKQKHDICRTNLSIILSKFILSEIIYKLGLLISNIFNEFINAD